MDRVDIVVIGAGIVGLAVAEKLSRLFRDVIIVEKEKTFGQHASSRNSEVIHSGIHYEKNSLKAGFCVQGNKDLYTFLKRHDIAHKRCGKLVVAEKPDQKSFLEILLQNGLTNGVKGLEILSSSRVQRMEPLFKASAALWVPSTGILDSHRVMKTLALLAEKNGAVISYNSKVESIRQETDGYLLSFRNTDYRISAPIVVNSAGLWSDRVCAMTGMDPAAFRYTLHWNKGDYYRTSRYRNIERLIYPLPDAEKGYLGIHTLTNLNGELCFGPNIYHVDRIDYKVDDTYHREFFDSIRSYLDIDYADIWPDKSGIRSALQGVGEPERDFVISNEKEKGYPGFINLIGINSPGLTCCLPIADYVASLLDYSG